jgi:hypothetical protein
MSPAMLLLFIARIVESLFVKDSTSEQSSQTRYIACQTDAKSEKWGGSSSSLAFKGKHIKTWQF